MAKSYFRFEEYTTFGQIGTSLGNCQLAGHLFTPANECVLEWNLRTRVLAGTYKHGTSPVTSLCTNVSSGKLAVGHQSGELEVWDVKKRTVVHSFEAHTGAVSTLAFSQDGLMLASGAQDTKVVVWDLVADAPSVRLQGHKDMITSLHFSSPTTLLTSSKDHLLKLWNLPTESSIDTLVHSREIYSFLPLPNHPILLTGTADATVHIWHQSSTSYEEVGTISALDSLKNYIKHMEIHKNQEVILIQSASPNFAVLKIRNEKEMEKLEKRRHKRLREKGKNDENAKNLLPSDQFQVIFTGKLEEKIVSSAFSPKITPGKTREIRLNLIFLLSNNQIMVHDLEYNSQKSTKLPGISSFLYSISHPGHRSAIRCLDLTPDNSLLLSGSGEMVKIWDVVSGTCVGSMESGYVLSVYCVRDGKNVVVGCKSGSIEVFSMERNRKIQEIQAHEGAVWMICGNPNSQNVVVSAGADKEVRYWSLNLHKGDLQLRLVDSFSLKDEILAVGFSPNGKFLCAALMDCTIQVLYADTRKYCLSLYAHKLPVTCFDVSSDSTILLSGSADKSVKLWGLDFGDCHKSILAHDQGIMSVKFLPETHYFFSVSKDHLVKYWDGDRHQLIMTLVGHAADVYALVVSAQGDFVVTGGGDYAIRVWRQTEEQLFLEEAREEELETSARPEDLGITPKDTEAGLVFTTSAAALKEGEQLIEALEGPGGPEGLLKALRNIRSSTLDSALQMLPFHYVSPMLQHLLSLCRSNLDIELIAHCTLVLTSIHESTISCSAQHGAYLDLLRSLRMEIGAKLAEFRDRIGRNLAACGHLTRQL